MKNPTPPELKIGDCVRRLIGYRYGERADERGEVLALGSNFRGTKRHPSAKVRFPSVRVPRWYFVDQLELVSDAVQEEIEIKS